jgi:hypothetical protein
MALPFRTYAGPAVPTSYDPSWQLFVNLTPAQIAAFQAFPQDLTKYVGIRRWQTEIAGITLPTGVRLATDQTSQSKIAALKQAIDNGTVNSTGVFPFLALDGVHQLSAADITVLYGFVVRYVQATYVVAASLLAGVNAIPQTITTRAQVDAAFAAITVS